MVPGDIVVFLEGRTRKIPGVGGVFSHKKTVRFSDATRVIHIPNAQAKCRRDFGIGP
jgi:hypothetical protein